MDVVILVHISSQVVDCGFVCANFEVKIPKFPLCHNCYNAQLHQYSTTVCTFKSKDLKAKKGDLNKESMKKTLLYD